MKIYYFGLNKSSIDIMRLVSEQSTNDTLSKLIALINSFEPKKDGGERRWCS